MNKVCWYRPEVVQVCLVVTEVVQQLLTVHIAVSSKYKYLSPLSLTHHFSAGLPTGVTAVEMSPEFLSKTHAGTEPERRERVSEVRLQGEYYQS